MKNIFLSALLVLSSLGLFSNCTQSKPNAKDAKKTAATVATQPLPAKMLKPPPATLLKK